LKNQNKLPVFEYFYSIQGEGAHTGKPAFFIRLAGCNVGCHWCDVKESWPIEGSQFLSVAEIIDKVKEAKTDLVIITGGEPLVHNLDKLTNELKKIHKKVHLETSGTEPFSGSFDWICFSPKKFKKPLDIYYELSDELKVVVFNKSDFSWADSHALLMKNQSFLYLQPESSVEKKVNPLIFDFIKINPNWKISLQIHKYLGVD
tara:strand:+ start:49107 stop:49715 length:609 start_codon:yes stop_codon:yes gene_type:complete